MRGRCHVRFLHRSERLLIDTFRLVVDVDARLGPGQQGRALSLDVQWLGLSWGLGRCDLCIILLLALKLLKLLLQELALGLGLCRACRVALTSIDRFVGTTKPFDLQFGSDGG